jgi:hypothetical protein
LNSRINLHFLSESRDPRAPQFAPIERSQKEFPREEEKESNRNGKRDYCQFAAGDEQAGGCRAHAQQPLRGDAIHANAYEYCPIQEIESAANLSLLDFVLGDFGLGDLGFGARPHRVYSPARGWKR